MPRRILICLCIAILSACGDSPGSPPVDPPCSTPLSLRRGEVRLLSGESVLSCVILGSSAEASEHLFVSANAATTADDVQAYRVNAFLGTGTLGSTAAKLPAGFASNASMQTGGDDAQNDRPNQFQSAFEHRLRQQERAQLEPYSLAALATAAEARRAFERRTRSALSAVPRVSDTLSFRVGNAASSNMCTNYRQVRGVVKAVGTRALIVLDTEAPNGGFSASDFQEIATEFDDVVYPVDAQWFGTPTDINGDGKITILFTAAINRLTPPGSLGFAGGFFYSGDLLPRSIPSQGYNCESSNEQEIIYLLAPDPNGQINGNRFSLTTARESSRGTTAHELQHLINQGVRQSVSRSATLEVTWLNEGLSHFAEEAVGRAVRRFSDFRRLRYADVLVDLDDYDSYFRQNLLRFRLWMERPDLASPISALAGSQLAPRGAAWALVRYAIDQYAGVDARAFTRALVAGPQVDVANLEARARVALDQILPGFLVANFADTSATSLEARYRYSSWAMRDAMTSLNGGVFPLRVTTLPADATMSSRSGSGNYFLFARGAAAGPATLRMSPTSGGASAFANARLYVVRVK